MIRVAAYCRVSTDHEDQANSFENQQRYFLEWIARNPDWELQGIYADEGLSGTSTKKRRQFHRMIQAAREGKVDLIITKEVSRFARNTLDVLDYTRELRRLGIGVIFLIDHINTMEQDGELRLTIMSSIAQEESRKTSDRVKWGQTRSMERGVVFGRSMLGYDVSGGEITVNPEGARIVASIFHQYLVEQKGAGAIAKELCQQGIRSSRGNVKWTASAVLKILKNEKYCGDLIQKKTYTPDYLSHEKKYNRGQEEQIVLRDHHPAIIDRAVWEAAQQEMKRRNHSRPDGGHGTRHPLSGKIRCGECGHTFSSRMKYGAVPYRIWRCGNAAAYGAAPQEAAEGRRGCGLGRQLRDDTAIALIQRALEMVPMDPNEVSDRLTRTVERVLEKRGEGELHRLEQTRRQEERRKQRALEALLDGTISGEDFRRVKQRCDEQIQHLQEQMDLSENGRREPPCNLSAVIQGIRRDPEFYGRLLDHMTVFKNGEIQVVLKDLPAKWTFAPPRGS